MPTWEGRVKDRKVGVRWNRSWQERQEGLGYERKWKPKVSSHTPTSPLLLDASGCMLVALVRLPAVLRLVAVRDGNVRYGNFMGYRSNNSYNIWNSMVPSKGWDKIHSWTSMIFGIATLPTVSCDEWKLQYLSGGETLLVQLAPHGSSPGPAPVRAGCVLDVSATCTIFKNPISVERRIWNVQKYSHVIPRFFFEIAIVYRCM